MTEQAVVAAAACGAARAAAPALARLRDRFPDSRRVDALTALYLDAIGKADEADALIAGALDGAPASPPLLKRAAALARSRGDARAAITALTAFLDAVQTDADAWAQLGDWHAAAGDAARAAFCYEEATLHAPTSAAAHTRLADALAAGRGPGRGVAAARPHYATASALAGGDGDARALWGLVATDGGGKAGKGGGGPATALAAAALLRRYRAEAPAKLPLAEAALRGLGVDPKSVA